MRTRHTAPLGAIVLALVLAVAPVAGAAPATGQWAAVGPAVPAILGLGHYNNLNGAQQGPDGRIYIYGLFTDMSGDPTADYLSAYDPVANTIVGLGSDGAGNGALNDVVFDIAFYNGMIVVAGLFTNAGGVAGATNLAAWTGTAWVGLGSFGGPVYSLATGGGMLFAGGNFLNANGVATADHIAGYNGSAWFGLTSFGALDGALTSMVWHVEATSDGRVFAAGLFANAGGNPDADYIAWFDGGSESWEKIGTAPGSPITTPDVNAIAVSGNRVVLGGVFQNAGGDPLADYIAEWTGTAWKHYGTKAGGPALNERVYDVSFYAGTVLAAGTFTEAGGVATADGVAAWNGAKWMALGAPNPNNIAYAVMTTGRTAYLSGAFSDLAGIAEADGIAAYGLPAPPSAPRAPIGVAGWRKVSLTWKAPLTANGAVLRDYVVQYRRSGTAAWLTFSDGVRTTRTATVTGLHSGWTYQFRVLAKNDWGAGAASPVITKRAF